MAKSSTVKQTLTTSENDGGFAWPAEKSYTNASPPLQADLVNLTTTPAALTIPAGTEWIIIVPPSGNATNLRVSGAVGETTGASMHPNRPLYWPAPSSGANLYLFAASGTINGVQVYFA